MKKAGLRQLIREEIQNVLTEWSQTKLGEDEYWVRVWLSVPESTRLSLIPPIDIAMKTINTLIKPYRGKVGHTLRWGNTAEVSIVGFGTDEKKAVTVAKKIFEEYRLPIDVVRVFKGRRQLIVKTFKD